MPNRTILGVFAHPDDETSCAAALFKRYAAEGVDIHIITATRGEMGALGTNGVVIEREDLPKVREAEQRAVLKHLGVRNPPIYLDYRDQEVERADRSEVVAKVYDVMRDVKPDVVLAFGPTGLSNHPDHIAMHAAAKEAFYQYIADTNKNIVLYYWALPKEVVKRFELGIDGVEVEPHVHLDVKSTWHAKVEALRLYASQEDAQELAGYFEQETAPMEVFHQAYPVIDSSARFDDLFHD
jgi:LmbE family N-acetylglucosaminyl deacetylase